MDPELGQNQSTPVDAFADQAMKKTKKDKRGGETNITNYHTRSR